MLTDYHVHLRPDEEGTPAEAYFTDVVASDPQPDGHLRIASTGAAPSRSPTGA